MRRNLLPVFSLLVGTLFLFFGNGLHSLLLPLRGTAEGYSTTTLGLLGTSWSTGFVAGCFLAPMSCAGSAMSGPFRLPVADGDHRAPDWHPD